MFDNIKNILFSPILYCKLNKYFVLSNFKHNKNSIKCLKFKKKYYLTKLFNIYFTIFTFYIFNLHN